MEVASVTRRNYFIYFATFVSSLTGFLTGAAVVWPSPYLPKFQSTDPNINPIGRPITTSEAAWIVSACSLGMTCGPPLSFIISRFFTKKSLLIIYTVPILASHCICMLASTVNLFIFGRFLSGLGSGAIWAILGSFIAEISEEHIRGLLCSIPGLMSCMGSLSVYIIGPYMSMTYFSLVNLIPVLLFFICFAAFVPDSPYDLLMRKKRVQAELSLGKLRRRSAVDKELLAMEDSLSYSQESVSFKLMLKDRSLRKGLFLCLSLMALQQLSGFMIVVTYAEVIFNLAGDFIPSSLSAVIVSICSLIGTLLSTSLIDRMGRKVLLTLSCILQAMCLFSLGLYFFLLDSGRDVSRLAWLPVASVMMTMLSFNLALGMGPWVVTGEVFHSSVKPLATTLASFTNFSLGFVVTMCFPYLVASVGMAWTFWVFAVCMILAATFCIAVLPETKGKQFTEILEILKK